MVRYSALATAVALSSFAVVADPGPQPVEHLTVYANRMASPVSAQLSSVVVLDRQAIEQAQMADLPALLAQIAGVQISRNGTKGHASSVYIRGGAAGHTLVLIDGVRIGAATLGYASLAELPLQQIEQIEVIKGPKAALYGSDAVSGVIAITTRKAEQPQLTVKAGRYGNREADFATAVRSGDLTLSANLGVARADGFDVRPGTQPDEDGYVQRFGKVAAAYQSSLGDWSLDHQRLQQDVHYDADPTWGGTDQADTQTDLTTLGWQYGSEPSQQTLKLARQKNADLNFGNNSPDSLFQTRRDELDYQYSHKLNAALTALAGVNWYQEEVYGTDYEVDSRINKALFAGVSYQQYGWLLDSTVRHDKQSQYGHQNTYQLSAGYQLTADWQLRFNRATAFKAPSFNDLYYPYSGNALLQPEHALSHELGLRYSGKTWQLDSSLYQQDVDNLVQWAPDDSGNWLPANVGKAKIQGAELSLAQQWQAFSQQLNYSYTDAKDTINDERLIKKSRHSMFWQGSYQWQQWRAFINSQYQSDFFTGDYSTPVQGGFTLWGAGLRWAPGHHWEMALKLDNLTNKDYQYVPGYAAPGSEWSLQVISRF
ncbi:TonB-dependent receptor [Rheinheimera sp.]|uniref:TonB-dependent receptor domain-containing protein n=1 Tax=Rheinheimera sp. TaxID=1869214 RepID=UPI00307DBCB0